MAPVQQIASVGPRKLRRNGAAARRSGACGQPTQGCARAGFLTERSKLEILEFFVSDLKLDSGDRGDREDSFSPVGHFNFDDDGVCATLRPEEQKDAFGFDCILQTEAVKDVGERKEARSYAGVRSNVGLAVSENLDHETRAAAAAAALLRRLAKVGPETTPEEAALMWAGLNGEAPNTRGEALPNPWRHRDPTESVVPEELRPRKSGKSVVFDAERDSEHEVVPYAEVYGRHPREFVFGREGEMLPAGDRWGFTGLAEDEPDQSEDDQSSDEEGEVSDELPVVTAPEDAYAAVPVC